MYNKKNYKTNNFFWVANQFTNLCRLKNMEDKTKNIEDTPKK